MENGTTAIAASNLACASTGKEIFNTTYYSTIEMAVTDWEKAGTEKPAGRKERLRSNVIVSDEASGFSDPDFWGEF